MTFIWNIIFQLTVGMFIKCYIADLFQTFTLYTESCGCVMCCISQVGLKLVGYCCADADKAVNGGSTSDSFEQSRLQAKAQLEKEDSDLEKAISVIIDVQVRFTPAFFINTCLSL